MFPEVSLKYKAVGYLGDILLKNSYYIGVSKSVKNDLSKLHFKSRTFLLTNAIDTKRLRFSVDHGEHNNIVIFSSAYYRKGTDIAVEAIRLSYLRGKVKLIIVTHNPKEAESILVKRYGKVPEFVKIVLPYKNIAKLYSNTFLFLSPSRSEAFGYSNLESAYSGLQVIASDIPGQNTLKEVPHITWIPGNNVNYLQKAIISAYKVKDSEAIKIQSKENKKFINKNYSLNSWTNNLMEIYNQISKAWKK